MLDVADKLLIQELLNRASYALDVQNLEQIKSCFTQDARMVVNIAGGTVVGPFEGRETIMKLMADSIDAQTDVRKHVISNILFEEVTGSNVHVTSNLTLFGTENGVVRLITTGFYHDQLKKIDGKWGIAVRQLDLDLPY
ncbi:MAG: nuclear transport factor 2 family protein [Emcibacter sp.]|nr:nuclear transport factor 2 family protein [Emcibacter sp.]